QPVFVFEPGAIIDGYLPAQREPGQNVFDGGVAAVIDGGAKVRDLVTVARQQKTIVDRCQNSNALSIQIRHREPHDVRAGRLHREVHPGALVARMRDLTSPATRRPDPATVVRALHGPVYPLPKPWENVAMRIKHHLGVAMRDTQASRNTECGLSVK